MLRLTGVGIQHAQATDEHGHFRSGEREQLRAVDQQLFGRDGEFRPLVIAKPIGCRLKHRKRFNVGLLLRGICATGSEGHLDFNTGILRGLLDTGASGQNNEIGQRNFFAAALRAIE